MEEYTEVELVEIIMDTNNVCVNLPVVMENQISLHNCEHLHDCTFSLPKDVKIIICS